MNVGDMVQSIYTKICEKPSGMFRMNLSGVDVKAQLANTIIDYAKLTSDNFFYTARASISCYVAADSKYMGWVNKVTGIVVLSYNANTGIISATNPAVDWTSSAQIDCSYHADCGAVGYILCCDIATCAKST